MNMKGSKKIWVTCLALLFSAGTVLSGCGENNNSGNATPPASVSKSDGASPATPELPEVTLRVFVPGAPQKDIGLINEEASKYLKEKINAKLELTIIDWGSWPDKMNLKFASNETFDISWTANWDNYVTRAQKGLYLPLNDLIDQYAPETKAILNPGLLKGGLINGKNYGLPVNKEIASTRGVLLNKALAEKYGIDPGKIKTLEDLEPYLKTIKDNEPGVTPFLMNKDVNPIGNTLAFGNEVEFPLGLTDGGAAIEAAGDNMKVFNMFEDPRYKAELDLTRKWYEAGYINKDAATLQDFDGALKAGQWFAFTDMLKPGKDVEKTNSHGVPMVQVELTEPVISTGDTIGSVMTISATSPNPERAMMFLNLLYTDKYLVNLLAFGIEGKHYVKKSENVISFPDGVDPSATGYNPGTAWMYGNMFNDYLFNNEDPEKWAKFKKFNSIAKESRILGFNFDVEPIKNEVTAFQNAYKEFSPALHTGAVDPNEVLPKFIEKMKAIGMDKVYAEVQRQIDAWQAAQ